MSPGRALYSCTRPRGEPGAARGSEGAEGGAPGAAVAAAAPLAAVGVGSPAAAAAAVGRVGWKTNPPGTAVRVAAGGWPRGLEGWAKCSLGAQGEGMQRRRVLVEGQATLRPCIWPALAMGYHTSRQLGLQLQRRGVEHTRSALFRSGPTTNPTKTPTTPLAGSLT